MKAFWLTCLALAGAQAGACTGSSRGDDFATDLAEYKKLEARLAERAHEFIGDGRAFETSADGERLYWVEMPVATELHSYDARSGLRFHYTFSIGNGDTANHKISSTAIATARRGGNGLRYAVYDASAPDRLLGQVDFPIPTDGQRWWAYALRGNELFVVTTGETTTLYRYAPGGSAVAVTTLESAGAEVGEFWDFAMFGERMVFLESGRIWSLDLAANAATWLHNETEASGGIADQDGVLFDTATGPWFFSYAAGAPTDLTAAITASDYQLNGSFSQAHRFYEGHVARFRQWMIYIGHAGVFGYDMKLGRVEPILLQPHDPMRQTDFRYPTVLSGGALFVSASTVTRDANGTVTSMDHAIVELDLTDVLPR